MFVVTGCPRSGTRWLARELRCDHEQETDRPNPVSGFMTRANADNAPDNYGQVSCLLLPAAEELLCAGVRVAFIVRHPKRIAESWWSRRGPDAVWDTNSRLRLMQSLIERFDLLFYRLEDYNLAPFAAHLGVYLNADDIDYTPANTSKHSIKCGGDALDWAMEFFGYVTD